MPMSERAIRNWEVRQLRHFYHLAKLLQLDRIVLIGIDNALEARGAKTESSRMMNIHQTMQRSGQHYDKV